MQSKSHLIKLCKQGATDIGIDLVMDPVIKERFNHELSVIEEGDLFDYFLIVQDIVQWAKNQGIMVGIARGSAAGSLICYLLGITGINPLDHDLLFERFLNPTRVASGLLPDIDIDFQKSRREEVIDYIKDKYGEDCVAQIPTLMKFGVRSGLRDLARIESVPVKEVDLVTKKIPDLMSANEALEIPEVKAFCKKYPRIGRLLPELIGSIRHRGRHAAGVIITPGPIDGFLSLERVTQNQCVCFDKDDAEAMGLLKMDILGLKTLDIISDTMKFVKEQQGINVELPTTYDDPEVFKLFRDGDLLGVFQFKTSTLTDFAQKVNIEDFREIYDTTSIVRPGTLHTGDADKYIENKFSMKPLEFEHPILEEILSPTQGVIVYQEQIMQIANRLGNLSLADAENIRKLVAKSKGSEALDKYRENFVKGAIENGLEKKKANGIWDKILKAGAYSFNKSHGVAYSIISYQTAWLSVYYPKEFLAANMKWEDGEKRLEAVEKARKLGFEVLTPDINRSQETVTINKKGQVIFGLGDIDQVGDKAVHDIIESRPFIDFDDFMGKRTPRHTNVRTVRHLIESGAFDKFGRRDELYYSITPDETPKTWEDQEMFLRQMSVLDLPPEVPMIEYFDNPFPVDTTEIRSIDWNEIRDEMYVKGVITSTTLKTGYGYMNINDGTGMVNVLMGEEILKIYEDVINRGVGTPVIIKVHMVKERTRLYADMIVPLDNYQNYEREIQYFDGSTETYADELAKYTSEHVGVVTSSNYFISKRGNRGTRLMLSNGLMFMCFDKMDKDIRAGDIVTYTISNEPFINVKEVR